MICKFFLETWSVCNIHQGRIELKLISGYCCWSELYLISVVESVSCGCYFIGSPRRINLLNLMCLPTKIQPDINKEQVLRFNRVLEIRLYVFKGTFLLLTWTCWTSEIQFVWSSLNFTNSQILLSKKMPWYSWLGSILKTNFQIWFACPSLNLMPQAQRYMGMFTKKGKSKVFKMSQQ